MNTIQATALTALLFIGILGAANEENPKMAKIPEAKIQGTWELKFPDGSRRLKFIGNGMWTITQADPATGKVVFHHGGSYTFDGETYIENVEFANDSTAGLIGSKHTFKLTLEGDVIHQEGIGNPWTEDWKRVEKR